MKKHINWFRVVVLALLIIAVCIASYNDIKISALRSDLTRLQTEVRNLEEKHGKMSNTLNQRTDPRWMNEQLMNMFQEDIKKGNFNR